ncbi:MAG: endopeptidase La [Planctomycetes bacterium]|nr:endopeptidase La [Planctomycetota bacterium]
MIDEPSSISLQTPGDERGGLPALLREPSALPETLFAFPLRRAVGFPGLVMPVLLDTEEARAIVEKAREQGEHLALILREDPDPKQPLRQVWRRMGVLVRIHKVMSLPDGNKSALCQGIARLKVKEFVEVRPFPIVNVSYPQDKGRPTKTTEALARNVQFLLKAIVEKNPNYGDEFQVAAVNIDQHGAMADFAAAYFVREALDKQKVLEELELTKRLRLANEILTREREILELGDRIQREIHGKIEKAQKEYYLREQMKIIRRELGEEKDRAELERETLEKRIAEAGMPEEVAKRSREELERLSTIPVESAEYSMVRTYLDWLCSLPWSKSSEDRTDVKLAESVLEDDHFGLLEVKERILEFLGVRQLRPGHAGPILCLVGPPGVGKTSLGRSIARATGRKFVRFSLGGMSDEAEIKGHRRTYVGAMPGRILQMLRQAGTNNPVMMLDELDKLGRDFRGDPSSALLEVLDPEQNTAFLDHYLDVPFDLSKVMFVATANVLERIPMPLRDRMEVIEIPGYVTEEKVQIAKRYLVPKQLENHGLTKQQLEMPLPALRSIIDHYTREAGVRGLEKAIARIGRKHALAVARKKGTKKLTLTAADLPKLLGAPTYTEDRERKADRPGVVLGLAWTGYGGDLLFIETVGWKGSGRLSRTGRLGEVMGESVRIAYDYLRAHHESFDLDADAMEKLDLHIHFPAGAVPKDGPSAGITITTAILSLLKGRVIRPSLAMTGELTLVGEVLPVGGIREKVLVARRFGVKTLILPKLNQKDVEELRPELIRGLRFHYVSRYEEVFAHAFSAGKDRPFLPGPKPAGVPAGEPVPRSSPPKKGRREKARRAPAKPPRTRMRT